MIKAPYKAALVTGAGHRIGRWIAQDLAQNGLSVAVHYNNSPDDAETLVAEINAAGRHAVAIQADLTDASAVSGLIANTSTALGTDVDVVVNNASIFERDQLTNFKADDWSRHQQINLLAPLLLMQGLANRLGPGQPGAVINLIDQRVLKLNPQYMSYTISKAGLLTATKTAAQALAPNIRVNAIGPGPTLANTQQSQEDFAREAASVPLGRGPTLEEISRAIRFLLETPSMTGQMVALDGGQHIAWRTADILED